MIRGEFNGRRPLISGLLLFPFSETYVRAKFLVDTGADISLVDSVAYDRAGFKYDQFRGYPPARSTGYGGKIEARCVPARLYLFDDDGKTAYPISLEIEVIRPPIIRPNEDPPPTLPSIIGRDVTDLFRLTIDRSENLVALERCADQTWSG